ncbi:MAG: 5'/3'-nucleotidase SurE [Bacillota bacterium]|nr:5'/3'-nucleotidase SurE [Bacillota bacterium]
MRILLTNDDSIYAEGLAALWSALREIADVTVIAPDRERSASGHGITVDQPLRAERIPFFGSFAWAVNGTPVDCVKLGVNCLLNDKPDLVVAGINRGPNLGIDVLYSGTVSGALEGIILGIPALAVSVTEYINPNYQDAAFFIRRLVPKVLKTQICTGTLLNINVPSLPVHEIRGIKITKLGARKYLNSFEVRTDPRGRAYYWLGGDVVDLDEDPNTDVAAIKQKMISITPIHVDLTNYRALELLQELFLEFTGE